MKARHLLLPILTLALLPSCARHAQAPAEATQQLPALQVRLATAQSVETFLPTELTGTVRPVQRALIAGKVMGSIEEMPVTLGQRVKTGELLVKISDGEISARVRQAQAQLNMASRDLKRERDLLTQNASTSDMVKGLEDRFSMMQALVREAEVMLANTLVRAPFDGVVARKLANAGDLAAPGVPLLEIEGTDVFQVEAGIPDSLTASLKTGQALTVLLPDSGTSFSGNLVEISSSADSQLRTVQVKISIPAETRVRSGQFARVQVPGAAMRALFVPLSTLSKLGQLERVFVEQEKRAVLRLIKTGATKGGSIEILSGVSEGERLIENPPGSLREGQALEVLP